MKWNNLSKLVLALGVSATLAACGGGDEASSDGAVAGTINVVSREDGSGTRGAFTEITGV